MSAGRRFLLAIGGVALLIGLGTLGYILIEDMTPIEALYMTVTTIYTVGFGEVKPLDTAGRLFTIALIMVGVGNLFYLVAVAAELLVEGRLRDYFGRTAMQHTINRLRDHIVVCGFGRFGRVVVDEMVRNAIPIVVVDHDPAREPELVRMGVPYVIGSALNDEVLDSTGIRNARAIVVATASDADNVYITLSAREKNPSIRIHARGESETGLRRLRLAGADQVISAYQWGGVRMASTILRPSVVDFIEFSIPGRGDNVDLEEILVSKEGALVGRTVIEVEQSIARLRVVALKRGAAPLSIIPEPSTRLEAGDYLVVIGDRQSVQRLSAS